MGMVVLMTMNRKFELKVDEYMHNGIPYCIKCKTARYAVFEDKVASCKCQCQYEEIQKAYEKERQQRIAEHLQNLKDKSLLGERYKDMSFDNIEIINDEHKKVIDRLKAFCEGFEDHNEGLGVFLFGTSGSGKTLLSACMLDKLNSKYIECLFTNIHKIKQELLSCDTKKQKTFMERLATVPVLFIDDFGTEGFKKNGEDNWVQDIVYDIVNTRYNNMLPIIYTSNSSLRECLEEKGVMQKTIDRIYETTVQIKLDLPSYRLRKKENIYF
jgi:DNA replication protein DnaC